MTKRVAQKSVRAKRKEKVIARKGATRYGLAMLSTHDVRKLLREESRRSGSAKRWAEARGIAARYVYDVMGGSRTPGPKILKALGYRRVVLYEPWRELVRPHGEDPVGDEVAVSARFLRSIGCFTGDLPQARGTVTELNNLGDLVIATVNWGDWPVEPKINARNLSRVTERGIMDLD